MNDTINTMTPGLAPGDKLGAFEVREQLASGGMGIVWKGYDSLLGRFVAIKQIAAAGDVDENFRVKFRSEAETQKRVSQSHPNIVDIIDLIDDARGLFIVMEFVEGASLDRVLVQQDGPLPTLQALRVVRDVAQALQAIHQAGVVHRDLKPGNILIDADGTAKVGDFGLATLMAEQDTLTMGTARYMAPEMFSDAGVDGRGDIYALGMISWEMLAGRRQFDESFKAILRDQRNQARRWMTWHTNERVTAPALQSVNEDVPQVLSDLVARMMAKDPGQRIASAAQLLETIQRHLSKQGRAQTAQEQAVAGAAIGAQAQAAAGMPMPGQTAATAALPTKRNTLLWVLVGTVAFWVVAIGGYFWWEAQQEKQAAQDYRAAGDAQFQKAIDYYVANDFAAAKSAFEQLEGKYPGDAKLDVDSRAYVQVCAARLALSAGDAALEADAPEQQLIVDARAHFEAAEAAWTQASEIGGDSRNSHLQGELVFLDREVPNRTAFIAIAGRIADFVDNKDFLEARRELLKLRENARDNETVFTDAEKKLLADLSAAIQDDAQRFAKQQRLDRAREQYEAGQFNEALRTLAEAEQALGDWKERRELKDLVSARMSYLDLLKRAQDAETRGDLAAAASLYTELNDLVATKSIGDAVPRGQIDQLNARIAYMRGLEHEKNDNIAAASAEYQRAVALADHPDARRRLNALGDEAQRQSKIEAGRTELRAGNYETAIKLFRDAQGIKPDPTVQELINEATVQLHLEKATKLVGNRELPAARSELQTVLGIDPSNAKASLLLSQIDEVKSLNTRLDEAYALRKKAEYGPAKREFDAIIKYADNIGWDIYGLAGVDRPALVEDRDDTYFDHLVQQVRRNADLRLTRQAWALYDTTVKARPNSPVLAELEQYVREHAGPRPKSQ